VEALFQKYKDRAWPELYGCYQEQLRCVLISARRKRFAAFWIMHTCIFTKTKMSFSLPYLIRRTIGASVRKNCLCGGPAFQESDVTLLAYISHKDILDVGGSWGNSLIVLRDDTRGHVISSDIAPLASRRARQWASKQCIIVNMGMSDRFGAEPRVGAFT
jgi:hypothetical protein